MASKSTYVNQVYQHETDVNEFGIVEFDTDVYASRTTLPSDRSPANRQIVNGYGVTHKDAEMGPYQFTRRLLLPDDVQIRLKYCGICHSDIHHWRDDWANSIYPMVPGHEMTGIVEKVGLRVTKFKINDRVAVGNLVNSCRKCTSCRDGDEMYCLNKVSWVYNGHDRIRLDNGEFELYPTGDMTFGGYSEMILVNQDFVLKVPDNLPLDRATPLLCAGITVFNPLKQFKVGPGDVVGIAGIGGLGHLAIKFAKSLGCTVIAITHSEWKIKDMDRLGADAVIYSGDKSQMKANQSTIDLIINTLPCPYNLDDYINLLKVYGKLHTVGVLQTFDKGPNGNKLSMKNIAITSSNVGGIQLTQEMLDYCGAKGITADIETISIDKVRDGFEGVMKSEVKYRYVIDLSTI
jgi:uncharacterized zinc-type alcohol dehydrogenase-like protein